MNEDDQNYLEDVGLSQQTVHNTRVNVEGVEVDYQIEDYVDFLQMIFDAYRMMGFDSNITVVNHNDSVYSKHLVTYDPKIDVIKTYASDS